MLVVLRDFHEFKLLVASRHSKRLFSKNEIYICSDKQLAFDHSFKVKQTLQWPKKPSLLRYVNAWLKRHRKYLLHYSVSESARQKTNSEIAFLPKSIAKILVGSSLARWLLISMLYLPTINFLDAITWILNLFTVRDKLNFDTIIFMRPNSVINEVISQKYSSSCTKIVTIIRNIDYPHLKANPVVESDYSICINAFSAAAVCDLKNNKAFGKVKNWEFWQNRVVTPSEKTNEFIFATSGPNFCPEEPYFLESVLTVLHELFGNDFKLSLRLIHDDNFERFRGVFERFSGIGTIDVKDELLTEQLSMQNVNNFKSLIIGKRALIATFSTIAWEVKSYGVPSIYLDLTTHQSAYYDREHMRYLVEKECIPLITDKTELRDFLSSC